MSTIKCQINYRSGLSIRCKAIQQLCNTRTYICTCIYNSYVIHVRIFARVCREATRVGTTLGIANIIRPRVGIITLEIDRKKTSLLHAFTKKSHIS